MSNIAFTKAELSAIHSAVDYLLGAELLEENGYTEEVIEALNSVLTKVEEEIIKDIPTVCKKCPYFAECDDQEECTVYQRSIKEKKE